MNKPSNFITKSKRAFIISLVYVGFGTISICSTSGSDLFYGDWAMYGVLITFPVTIISFGYRFAETNYLIPVIIIQFIMFILTFIFLSLIIKENKNNLSH